MCSSEVEVEDDIDIDVHRLVVSGYNVNLIKVLAK